MCFAVNQANKAELDKQLLLWPQGDLPLIGWTPKRWMDAFTHPLMPIILNDRTVGLAEWGLIPIWTKDEADAKVRQNQTLNAKAETIHELPSFQGSATKKRCLVPVNGFFEYQHLNKAGEPDPSGKVTKPYRLFLRDKTVFYLGGLWTEWHGRKSFTIVTMPANTLMSRIHNAKLRMPVIVPPQAAELWLAGGSTAELQPFVQPRDDLGLVAEETEGKPKKGEEDQGGLF